MYKPNLKAPDIAAPENRTQEAKEESKTNDIIINLKDKSI